MLRQQSRSMSCLTSRSRADPVEKIDVAGEQGQEVTRGRSWRDDCEGSTRARAHSALILRPRPLPLVSQRKSWLQPMAMDAPRAPLPLALDAHMLLESDTCSTQCWRLGRVLAFFFLRFVYNGRRVGFMKYTRGPAGAPYLS